MENKLQPTKTQITTTTIEKICNIETLEKTAELPDRAFFDQTYNENKIKELQNSKGFRTQIGIVLTKIAFMCGIKNPIDDLTKQDIIRLILRRYAVFSVAEIYKAFENERYGINANKTEHFQLFDSNYISTIMDKYIQWKQTQKQNLNWVAKQQTPELPELSDKQKHEIMTNEISRLFTTYLLQKHLDNQIIVHVYQELCDRNIIKQKANNPQEQDSLNIYFEKQYNIAKQQIQTEYQQKARQSNYYRQALNQLQERQNGAVITQMQRNILCQLFEKNRYNQDFVKQINHKL